MDQNTVPHSRRSDALNADPMDEFWSILALPRMGYHVFTIVYGADGPEHANILRIHGHCTSYVNYVVFMWLLCWLVVLLC